jgi:hypothetical protein
MPGMYTVTHQLTHFNFEMGTTFTYAISAPSLTATWCKNPKEELKPILTNCFTILENRAIWMRFVLGNSCESRNSITKILFCC